MKNKDTLGQALRALPRTRAGDRFTESVMSRLDTPGRSLGLVRFWPAGAAALLVAAVVLTAFMVHERPRKNSPAGAPSHVRAQLQALRADQMKLQQEWRHIRQMQRDRAPVLRLGGDEQVDLVLDLRDLPPGSVQLASQSTSRPDPRAGSDPHLKNPVQPQGRGSHRPSRRPR